ncbi:MAG: c-type cytochrome [Proteobacteria bacterium]|nr:c-type cytochrome [Pseudomonadota bacterium]
MLTVTKMAQAPLMKSILVLVAALYATANIADTSEPLQLAQLSEGFNAQQKYMASCFACHSTGAAGAPKVGAGMAAEWAPRLEKGMDAVVANSINGLNTMPAKGLCFDCTDADLRAIVEYMIESSK